MRESYRAPGSVVVPLESGDREFLGDARVYGWSAKLGNPPSVVASALMALEQYFYLELDAKKPVRKKVRAVLDRVRSVAFLKVLCDIGRRDPALFEGSIRPLLAVPEIYFWDIITREYGRAHLMDRAAKHGPWFVELAKNFHELEHRALDLRHVAPELFLNRPRTRAFFDKARRSWEARMRVAPEDQFREFLQELVILFDIENYSFEEHSNRGPVLVNVRVRELEAERAEERRASEERDLVRYLPVCSRQLITEGTGLPADQLEPLWDDLQHVAAMAGLGAASKSHTDQMPQACTAPAPTKREEQGPDEGDVLARCFRALRGFFGGGRGGGAGRASEPLPLRASTSVSELETDARSSNEVANAIIGAVAVLVRLHGDWLARHPERKQWCLDQLEAVVLNPPLRHHFDVPESTGNVDLGLLRR